MRCPERRAAARTIDFGDRIALDAASQESTVFDAIPMGRANAITVSLVVASMPRRGGFDRHSCEQRR